MIETKSMKIIWKALLAASACAAVSACTASQTPGPPITSVCVTCASYSHLQLAVGTANFYGTASGLNVVSTLRQPDGASALGVDTPSLSGPFVLTVGAAPANGTMSDPYSTYPNLGPSLAESGEASPAIAGTPQSVQIGTPACDTTMVVGGFTTCPVGISPNASTFGESGGVFAMGLAPYNVEAETSNAYSYQPFGQPFYDVSGHQQLIPWGGPPAFDPDGDGMGTRDGLVQIGNDSFGDAYFLGVGEGITSFVGVTPSAGTYSLAVQIGIAGSGGPTFKTISTTAALNSLALLGTASAPLVTPDANGDGGATVAVTLPAGATEAEVQIVDWGPGGGPNNGGALVANCHGPKGEQFAPVYYTLEVTSSGVADLPPDDGPNTNLNGGRSNLTPSHSICTLADNQSPPDGITPVAAGDDFTVQMIGFDYPAYEAAVSLLAKSVPQAPAIAGTGGQADITISAPVEEDYPNYNVQIPLDRVRHHVRPHAVVRHPRVRPV
jgi:hypothetical protein